MAITSYDESLRRLLMHEGGYTNHPSDPGGPTNFGITIHDYRKYVMPGAAAADVKAMTLAEAKGIYRAKYWDAQRCDELPAGVDYAVFDYGVNSGVGRSGKVLRRLLKLADNTGIVNDAVIAAVRQADAQALVAAICDERLRFLMSLKTWGVFGKGWGRRVAEVKAASLSMAAGAAPSRGGAVMRPSKAAQHGTAGAIAAAGAAAAAQAHQSGVQAPIVVAIVIVGVALAAGAWSFWRWKEQRSCGTR
jgi:lysozyme family protein